MRQRLLNAFGNSHKRGHQSGEKTYDCATSICGTLPKRVEPVVARGWCLRRATTVQKLLDDLFLDQVRPVNVRVAISREAAFSNAEARHRQVDDSGATFLEPGLGFHNDTALTAAVVASQGNIQRGLIAQLLQLSNEYINVAAVFFLNVLRAQAPKRNTPFAARLLYRLRLVGRNELREFASTVRYPSLDAVKILPHDDLY